MPILKCTCGHSTIVRDKRLLSKAALEALAGPIRAAMTELQGPDGKLNQAPAGAAYDVWRRVVRALEETCGDTLAACPKCGRLWLTPEGGAPKAYTPDA